MRQRLLAAGASWVLALVVVAAVARPEERCPSVTAADAHEAVAAAIGWFAENQHGDGRWRYLYDRSTEEDDPGYNIVRHAGVLLSLYQSEGAGFAEAAPVADRGLEYVRPLIVRNDGRAAFTTGDVAQAGASALLLNALVERRIARGTDDLDPLLRELGAFLEGQVTAGGQVTADWVVATGEPVAGTTSRYYTGQAMWGLARLHALFPDEGWDEPARRVSRYLSTERDEAEGWFPPIADHWAAYGLAEQAAWPTGAELTPADVAYAEHLAGSFANQTRFESQRRDDFPGVILRVSIGSASGVGTLGEGLGALWRLGQDDDRFAPHVDAITPDLQCVAGILVDRQVRDGDPREVGAWFRHDETRMDDQQHAASALLAAIPTLENP
jgi:hypothetical protein